MVAKDKAQLLEAIGVTDSKGNYQTEDYSE